MHTRTIYNLLSRSIDRSVPVQTLWQDLRSKVFNVHPSTIVWQGAQIQLRSLRQEVQVQTQTTVASDVECTRLTAMITI